MSPPFFPNLAGQGRSVHKKPMFSTLVASHVSGREVRDPLYQNPIWQFEVTFDGLASDSTTYPGAGAQSLQSLMGLYLQCQGKYGTFLYTDPTDNAVSNQVFAMGDGATTTFTFARTLGGFRARRLGDQRLPGDLGWRRPAHGVVAFGAKQPRLLSPAGQRSADRGVFRLRLLVPLR